MILMGCIKHLFNSLSHCAISNFIFYQWWDTEALRSYFRRLIWISLWTHSYILIFITLFCVFFKKNISQCGLGSKGLFHRVSSHGQYVWWKGINSWMWVRGRKENMRKKAYLETNRWTNRERKYNNRERVRHSVTKGNGTLRNRC